MRNLIKTAGGALALMIVPAMAALDIAWAQMAAEPVAPAASSLDERVAEAAGQNRLIVLRAAIEGGKLVVTGVTPEPDQRVTLDGEHLTRSDDRHFFEFVRTYLPSDCIVKLKSGRRKARAIVRYCGPAGPRGKAGATGAPGAAGPRGAGDISSVHRFSGKIGTIAGGQSAPAVFAGETADITLAEEQRILGNAQGALGLSGGNTGVGRVGLCYQSLPNGPVLDVNGSDFLLVTFIAERQIYAAGGSIALPAGAYRVGFCVQNLGEISLDDNDVAQGWVMITNE